MKKFGVILLVALTGCVTVDNSGGGDGNGGGGGGSKGASGVVAKKKAIDFTPAEKDTFCEWVKKKSDEKAGVYTCESGKVTISPYSAAECEAELAKNKGCDATALEKCFEALFDEPCVLDSGLPAACAGLAECASAQSDNNGASPNNGVPANNGSTKEFCYEHTVNGETTGKQCFSTHEAYCDSLCAETNIISEQACTDECP